MTMKQTATAKNHRHREACPLLEGVRLAGVAVSIQRLTESTIHASRTIDPKI
jgi:hypothetical protein